MKDKKLLLEELPEFASYPFNRVSDVPVFEVARITGEMIPHTLVPYRLQKLLYVVGRSPDSKSIYYSSNVMVRDDGKILALHGVDSGGLSVDYIEKYEVVIPNDKLPNSIGKNRI